MITSPNRTLDLEDLENWISIFSFNKTDFVIRPDKPYHVVITQQPSLEAEKSKMFSQLSNKSFCICNSQISTQYKNKMKSHHVNNETCNCIVLEICNCIWMAHDNLLTFCPFLVGKVCRVAGSRLFYELATAEHNIILALLTLLTGSPVG